jgi:hypothetical protein
MKKMLALLMLVAPAMLLASTSHEIRLVLNVVDDYERAVKMQDAPLGKKMFKQLFENDPNLAFVADIGFKYIKTIVIDMNNDTYDSLQTIVVRTSDDRVVVRRVGFFNSSKNQARRYVFTASRFENKKYDKSLYYLASYSR